MARMLLASLCIILTVGVVKSKVERLWANKDIVRPGESFLLTCEFSDLDPHDLTHFYKNFPGNKTTALTNSYVLADNLLDATTRFNFSYKELGNGVATQTLGILNAVVGDSGNYSCYMRDGDKSMAYSVYLQVYVEDEPDTIKLYLDDIEIYNGTNSVPIKLLQARRLRCETTRSNPGANITITTGNDNPVRLTSTVSSNATYQFDERDQTYEFVVPVYRNTTALATNWVFDTDGYNKPVVCRARVNRDVQGIMTSFIPEIADGPPQIECNDTVYARDGLRNFDIVCTSFAKPSITDARFYYIKAGMNYTIQGFPKDTEHTSTDGKVRVIVQKNDDIKSTLHVMIQVVDLKAANAFNFLVANSYGQDIHRVTIKDPSTAPSSSSALSSCLIASLLIWLVGFGIRAQL